MHELGGIKRRDYTPKFETVYKISMKLEGEYIDNTNIWGKAFSNFEVVHCS